METYISLWFNSDGTSAAEVVKKLKGLEFMPLQGSEDMSYKWDTKPSVDDVLSLGILVQKALKGDKVLFKMRTV